MKKTITATLKVKRYTVKEGNQRILNTSSHKVATTRINELQMLNKPLIILLDEVSKTAIYYEKTIHQKNYRVESGDFEKDMALPPVAGVTETES